MTGPYELGVQAFRAGQMEEARAHFEQAFSLAPDSAEVRYALATACARLRRFNEAAGIFAPLASQLANDAGVQFEYGAILADAGRPAEAVEYFERCLRISPAELAAFDRLALALLSLDNLAGAREAYERSLRACPGRAAAYYQPFRAFLRMGMVDDAIAYIRRGVDAVPVSVELREMLAHASNLSGSMSREEVLALHRSLGSLVSAGHPPRDRHAFPNPPEPDRPLNVALLSGDFCFHACAFFLTSLIAGADPARMRLFCYASNQPDETSRRFGAIAPYRDVRGVDDGQLGAMLAQDAIDVAVDCSGWSDRSRLPALARRLAPVQATWLGYPNTTGVPAIDWRIVDATTDPAGAEEFCTERLLRLDRCFVCYTPAGATPRRSPPGAPLGPVTFGSFSRVSKICDRTVALWSRALLACPGAQLRLKSELLAPVARRRLIDRFVAQGLDPSRIRIDDYQPNPADHLASYAAVDVALDPVTYNGTTTTCEAAIMGVPTVTLPGATHRSRVGASLLGAMGLRECVASDESSFISIAASLANDTPRLHALHEELPAKVRASALCDARAFGASFERALRAAWQEWCAGSLHT